MRNRSKAVALAALLLVAAGCASGYSETRVAAPYRGSTGDVSVSGFYDALAPYGTWIDYAPYGWCWTPRDVGPEWRPYSDGYWVYTDYGWSWVSNEPWGWAACHYGRWLFDDDEGWVWVPGTVWSSAWVAWRYDDDWVGWAPLPPGDGWDGAISVSSYDSGRLPVASWCFVQRGHLLDTNLRGQVVSVARNPTLLEDTRDATRFEAREGRSVNRGLDLAVAQRLAGRDIQQWHVADIQQPPRGRGSFTGVGAVGFYRPVIRDATPAGGPKTAARQPRLAVPDPIRHQREDEERRRLDRALADERANLQHQHERELHAQAQGVSIDQIRRRHESENQAFEAHAARQRHLLDRRLKQLNPGPPPNAQKADDPDRKDNGRGKRRGGGTN